MKYSGKQIGIGVGIAAVAVVAVVAFTNKKTMNFADKYAGVDLSVGVESMERSGTYTGYLRDHKGAAMPSKDVVVDVTKFTVDGEAYVQNGINGKDNVLYTAANSKVTWTIDVPEAGFYNVFAEFLIPQSRGVAAERSIYINGELPFDSALDISFSRIWKDKGDPKQDNQGNWIRPTQEESIEWQSAYFRDSLGYVTEPYQFYFEKGTNTITFGAENEPMIFSNIEVKGIKEMDSYTEYLAKTPSQGNDIKALDYTEVVQGEDSTFRSESSLYAKYDRSSPTTVPNSVTYTVLNYVGGEAWKDSGQWIEWNIEVPEDGYYNIMVKGRQNYQRGSVSSRSVLIDGEIPFKEMKEIQFAYSNDWECKTLADENGEPYLFYLTKGTHTLRLEATLGSMGPILEDLSDSTFRLNQIYRHILVYTGSTPDVYRDYKIEKVFPEAIEAMDIEAKRLYKIVDDMVLYTGQKADQIASAQTVAQQLDRFVAKPNKITVEFTTFKDNVTALGTAALNLSSTKLDIDYITVTSPDVKVKKDKANIFTKLWHECKSFAASFYVDYNSVGDVYDASSEDVVKVWIMTGRDQGTILKSMVDDDFTPNSGVKVNVEIVAADALLNAVIAGRGPNVVLSVGANQPVDFALRGASEDLTQFSDLDQVLSHYTKSSYEQYGLTEDGKYSLYGLPETQTFNVMFYRKDVLDELGLEVPNTWKDLIEILPTIQGRNMTVAIPTAAGSSGSAVASTSIASTAPDLSMYFSLLYQYGGDMYNDEGTKTVVQEEAGVKAFDDYTRYFNDYGLPMIYDFVSRFRTGEMPIGIASYSTYNTLMVSAPEIRGLWDFTLIPGTEKVNENGEKYIDRSDFITGSATMMIKTDKDSLRNASWEFMKWWASVDTQVRFGREIEALLGSSARYNTANKDAFCNLAWSAGDIETLSAQWDQTVGIREVPGGYYTGRHIANAARKVLNDKDDARETLIDYSIKIDEEITKKRIEFGLKTAED